MLGKYSVEKPSNAIYRAYLENLVVFVKWLLTQEYDIRLLIGDTCDWRVTEEFQILANRCGPGTCTDESVLSMNRHFCRAIAAADRSD